MPKLMVATLSRDALAQESASRRASQTSDSAYLVSFGIVAALIIGVFFGVGFSLIALPTKEHITVGPPTRDRGFEVDASSSSAFQDSHDDPRSVSIEAELPHSSATRSFPTAPPMQVPDSVLPDNAAPPPPRLVRLPAGRRPPQQSAAREATLALPARAFTFAAAAYDLVRLPKLIGATT